MFTQAAPNKSNSTFSSERTCQSPIILHNCLICISILFPSALLYAICNAWKDDGTDSPSLLLFTKLLFVDNFIHKQIAPYVLATIVSWIIVVPARAAQLSVYFKREEVCETIDEYKTCEWINLIATSCGWVCPIAFFIAFFMPNMDLSQHDSASIALIVCTLVYFTLHTFMTLYQAFRLSTIGDQQMGFRYTWVGMYFVFCQLVSGVTFGIVGLSSTKYLELPWNVINLMEWTGVMFIPMYAFGLIPLFLWKLKDEGKDGKPLFCGEWCHNWCCVDVADRSQDGSETSATYYYHTI